MISSNKQVITTWMNVNRSHIRSFLFSMNYLVFFTYLNKFKWSLYRGFRVIKKFDSTIFRCWYDNWHRRMKFYVINGLCMIIECSNNGTCSCIIFNFCFCLMMMIHFIYIEQLEKNLEKTLDFTFNELSALPVATYRPTCKLYQCTLNTIMRKFSNSTWTFMCCYKSCNKTNLFAFG